MRLSNHDEALLRSAFFRLLADINLPIKQIGEMFDVCYETVRRDLRQGTPKFHQIPTNPEWVRLGGKPEGRSLARARVRIRDKYTCQDCNAVRTPETVRGHNNIIIGLKGRTKLFDVHHLNGMCGKNSRGYDSTEDLSGLVILCHKCHYNRHDHAAYGKHRVQPLPPLKTSLYVPQNV